MPGQARVPERCAVLVAGGGVAGLATAIEARRLGLDVVVAEARDRPVERYGETLAPGGAMLAGRLGLGDLAADGHLACPGTVVDWGRTVPGVADRSGANDFVLDPYGPSWHLDRAGFESALRARAVATGAVLITGVRARLRPDEGADHHRVVLQTAAGEWSVRAEWLVDATGPSASIARRLGAVRRVHDRLVALVRIGPDPPSPSGSGVSTHRTLIEAAPHGWWYLSRLPAHRLATVLVTEPAAVPGLVSDVWSGWGRALSATRLLASFLPEPLTCTRHSRRGEGADDANDIRRRVRSVAVASLEPAAGRRWLAVGDAAAEFDPVCGRGLYEALDDARHAARVIAAQLGGDGEGVDQPSPTYVERIAERAAAHRAQRYGWYAQERRWPDAPFWRARRNAPA